MQAGFRIGALLQILNDSVGNDGVALRTSPHRLPRARSAPARGPDVPRSGVETGSVETGARRTDTSVPDGAPQPRRVADTPQSPGAPDLPARALRRKAS